MRGAGEWRQAGVALQRRLDGRRRADDRRDRGQEFAHRRRLVNAGDGGVFLVREVDAGELHRVVGRDRQDPARAHPLRRLRWAVELVTVVLPPQHELAELIQPIIEPGRGFDELDVTRLPGREDLRDSLAHGTRDGAATRSESRAEHQGDDGERETADHTLPPAAAPYRAAA